MQKNLLQNFLTKDVFKKDYIKFIVFIFLFTTLSGALRKWVITNPSFSNFVLAIQICIPASFMFLKNSLSFSFEFKNLFIVFSTYLILLFLLAFNPLNLTPMHGFLGLFIHSGFWIGMFIFLKIRNQLEIQLLIPFFIVITLAQFFLGSIQSASPGDSLINRYAAQTNEGLPDAYVGDAVRVTGTFSYISGFNSYLIFATLLCCALIKLNYKNVVTLIVLAGTYYGCLISGSRGSTYFFMVTIPLFIITCVGLKQNFKLIISFGAILLFGSLIKYVTNDDLGVQNLFGKSYDNFETRVEGSESSMERIQAPILEVINYNGPNPIFGIGLGSTYQGAVQIFGFNPLLYGVELESEPKRIIVEGGYLLYFFRLLLFFYLFKSLKMNWIFKGFILGSIYFGIAIVFNIYTSFYSMLGLMLLDKVYQIVDDEKKSNFGNRYIRSSK